MVETIDEAKRRGKKDIPSLGKLKNISYAPEWGTQFNYPLHQMPVADYYVEYDYGGGKSVFWLMEVCNSHLHANLKQLQASATFFRENEIRVDGYLIVIDGLTKTDKNRYSLKDSTNKPLKEIEERHGYSEKSPVLTCKKPTFLVFRKDFKRLTK